MSLFLDLPATAAHNVTTPSHASLDIVSDIELSGRITIDDLSPASQVAILSKMPGSGATGYRFRMETTSELDYAWGDGAFSGDKRSTASLSSVGVVVGDKVWVKVTHDVDDGASDDSLTFWYSLDDTNIEAEVSWTQLGNVKKHGSTTSISTNSQALQVGSHQNGTPWEGGMYRVVAKDGIDGTVVADFAGDDFTLGDSDTDTAVDSTGKTWTINGTAAEIRDDTLVELRGSIPIPGI